MSSFSKNIEQTNFMAKIFYLIPDLGRQQFSATRFLKSFYSGSPLEYLNNLNAKPKPVGGVKVMYQHCMLLQQLGYEAYPLIMGKYIGDFFGFDIETKHIKETGYELSTEDIVVCPEFMPYLGLSFKNATKIIFNQSQSWHYHNDRLKLEDIGKNFIELGHDYVMNCGQYLCEQLKAHMHIDSHSVVNGIDHHRFIAAPEKRITNRLLALSRKRPENLEKIVALSQGMGLEYRLVDGLSEIELIQEYQRADFFIATGYPEGFSLPPLEAMSCGCAVIGFTGGGAGEFMLHEDTAMVANDGDCETVVKYIAKLQSDLELKEKIRKNGMAKATEYSLENTCKELDLFYQQVYRDIDAKLSNH